jgi:hypothetical protein
LKSAKALLVGKNVDTKQQIMRDAGGKGAQLKLTARRLTQFGLFSGHSEVANSKAKLASMESAAMLAASTAQIDNAIKREAEEKKGREEKDLVLLSAASAKEKLAAKNGDVKKLTVKEITALLFVCYSIHAPAKVLKPGLVELLLGKIAVNPGVLALSSTTSEVTPVVTAADHGDEQ